MKKVMQKVLAATFICGLATVFYSCGHDEEEIVIPPVTPPTTARWVIASEQSSSESSTSRTEYKYDILGRVVEETYNSEMTFNGETYNGETKYTYTYGNGSIERIYTNITEGYSDKTIYYFNSQGIIVKQISYDRLGLMDYEYTYSYDALGYLTRIIDTEDNRVITLEWLNGNLITIDLGSASCAVTYGTTLSNGYTFSPNNFIGTTSWVDDNLWRQGNFGQVSTHLPTQNSGGLWMSSPKHTYTIVGGLVTSHTITTEMGSVSNNIVTNITWLALQ